MPSEVAQPAAPSVASQPGKRRFAWMKFKHVLFFSLLSAGIIPLAISSLLLIGQNREILQNQEREYLVRSAEGLSRRLSSYLDGVRMELQRLGGSLLVLPGPEEGPDAIELRLRQPWVGPYLEDYLRASPDLVALRALDPSGSGPRIGPKDLAGASQAAMDDAFDRALSGRQAAFQVADLPGSAEPLAVLAVPVLGPGGKPRLVLEGLARLRLTEAVAGRPLAEGELAIFLIDRQQKVLWSQGDTPVMREALQSSGLLRDFTQTPLSLIGQLPVSTAGKRQQIQATVSPVESTDWGVVVLKPRSVARAAVDRMVFNTLLSSVLLIALSLLFAALAARRVGKPLQRLAETSHQVAAGNFGRRVETRGLAFEVADLAHDFNRMGEHVELYVAQLQRAAQANRELFIGSIRAFAAAIDAKDPYTRGHSERVAATSRTMARLLSFPEDFQQKVWLGALLHDVGKIGIEDRILQKGGVLTPQEYEAMKAHPVIGADILSPIEQLREMIPAVRWHHENWNGRGYPDGLKGEEIPLAARIVAVADCFDAITTNRPYQRAYDLQFAVETITKLAGTRFDAKMVTAFLRAVDLGEIQVPPQEETPRAAVRGRSSVLVFS